MGEPDRFEYYSLISRISSALRKSPASKPRFIARPLIIQGDDFEMSPSVTHGSRPLPPLYGIWEVRQMSIDEQPRPPLLTDSTRWRRAIFDYPDRMVFQRTDDSFAPYGASVNLADRTLALTKKDLKSFAFVTRDERCRWPDSEARQSSERKVMET